MCLGPCKRFSVTCSRLLYRAGCRTLGSLTSRLDYLYGGFEARLRAPNMTHEAPGAGWITCFGVSSEYFFSNSAKFCWDVNASEVTTDSIQM